MAPEGQVAVSMVAGAAMLLFAALGNARETASWLRGMVDWTAYIVGASAVGYATWVFAVLVVDALFASEPRTLEWMKLLGLAAFLGAALCHGAFVNVLRRRAGLPPGPLLVQMRPPTLPEGEPLLPEDISTALHRAYGLGVWNPGLWLLVLLLFAVWVAYWDDVLLPLHDPIVVTILAASAVVVAWLWIAFQVPRWRVWALAHVEDIDLLERAALNHGLLWSPRGRFGRMLTRMEIWTPQLRQRARDLRRGRGGPSWSGDLELNGQ
jgi:hypothetical protein